MYKLIFFIPEIFFFSIILIIFIFSTIFNLSSVLKFPNMNISTIYFFLLSSIYVVLLFSNHIIYFFDASLVVKSESNILISIFSIVITLLIFIFSIQYNKKNFIGSQEYIIFILISLGSLLIFLNLYNIIFIYILLELQNILISILISIKKYNRYCIEASIKYFILGSFSSLIFLYGFSLLYGTTGTISLYEIHIFINSIDNISNSLVTLSLKISILFILMGMLSKIYSAPFHFWVSDIYEGSPTSILIYISSVQSLFMVSLFIKFYYYIFIDYTELKNLILSIVSLLTLSLGSIGALTQRKLKRLIGFSAVTVNGFFLFSIINNNPILLEISFTYSIIYVITILLFSGIVLNLYTNNKTSLTNLSDLYTLYKSNKLSALLIVSLLFSVSGLPPFIGFFGKLFWLKSLFSEYNVYLFILISIFILVNFYYIRVIKNIYSLNDKSNNTLDYIGQYSYFSSVLIFFIQFLLLYFIVESGFLRNIVHLYISYLINVL